jgi:hypothetical protein
MCLPVKPYKIEKEWIHKGLHCAVVMARPAAHRCGYVRVPPSHPAFQQKYDEIDVNVHGGLTFSELEPCIEHPDGQGWWLGFDCAHYYDSPYDTNADRSTLDAATQGLLEFYDQRLQSKEHYWTEREVIQETEKLADQLVEMAHVQ